MKYKIYTDGSCEPNGRIPNKGAWAFVVYNSLNEKITEYAGKAKDTSNNRMEIQALIEVLKWVTDNLEGLPISVYSDSQYVVNGYNYGFKKKDYLNKDLWDIIFANKNNNISLQWIKGHNGNIGNEAANDLAEKLRKI